MFGAGTIGDIVIKIKADLAQLEESLEKAKSQVKDFGKRLQDVGKDLAVAGAKMGAAIAPVALALGHAVRTGAEFEQAMKNVQSVMGASEEDFKRLTEFAKRLGETTVFSASQAAEGLYFLASAGYKVDEAISAMEPILQFAAATQSDLASATELVVSTLNAFEMDASEASRVANVFAAAISNSQLTMERLAVAMPYISGLAKSLGISLEETTATIGLLVSSGIRAESAGRLLASSLGSLMNPTDKAQEVLEKYGLTLDDVNPKMHSLAELVDILKEKNISAADVIKIFGDEGARVWLKLIPMGGEKIREMEQSITGTSKATEMAAIQLDSFQGLIRLVKSELEGIEIAVFDELKNDLTRLVRAFKDALPTIKEFAISFTRGILPAIEGVLKAGKDFMQWFNSLNPHVKNAIAVLMGFTTALMAIGAPLLILIGGLINATGSIVSFAGSLAGLTGISFSTATALTALRTALTFLTGPIGILITAASMLFVAYQTNFLGIRDVVNSAVGWVVDRLSDLVDWMANTIPGVRTLTDFFDALNDTLGSVGERLKEVLNIDTASKASEIEEYNQRIAESERELADAKQRLIEKQRELDEVMDEYHKKQLELEQATNKVKEAEEELAEAKERLLNYTKDLQEAEEDLLKTRLDFKSAQLSVKDAEDDLEDAKERLRKAQEKARVALERYGRNSREYAKALKEVEKAERNVEKAEIRLERARLRVKDLEEAITEKEKEVIKVRNSKEERTRAVEKAQKKYSKALEEQKRILRELSELEENMEKLKLEVEVEQEKYDRAEELLNKVKNKVKELEDQTADSSGKIKDKFDDMAETTEKSSKRMVDSIDTVISKLEELEEELGIYSKTSFGSSPSRKYIENARPTQTTPPPAKAKPEEPSQPRKPFYDVDRSIYAVKSAIQSVTSSVKALSNQIGRIQSVTAAPSVTVTPVIPVHETVQKSVTIKNIQPRIEIRDVVVRQEADIDAIVEKVNRKLVELI
ncbi:phage tail tape measure protein, TP901 family, core region [Archaeoglobus sulfaticallidus PM70-1]|uniref:Phage tail tape measure protein, TP901 family, core region n=1 Tax=Archaeoglobus sulfaticallidus PM70-1 TaxID=387631 RepID=N0BGY2_9EURY|nr:phage tail tape measure protein [Archaeoglobus sulfaticallidus]AGK61517.1 phage tail tape measure protein, TP901 family, core region [Archaeoglobus sulfaticallidus PM70-1]